MRSRLGPYSSFLTNPRQLASKITFILRNRGVSGLYRKFREVVVGHTYDEYIRYTKLSPKDIFEMRNRILALRYKPLISIVLPLYDSDDPLASRCLDSIRNQIYPNWELCIGVAKEAGQLIDKLLGKVRFRACKVAHSEGQFAWYNKPVELAGGDFVTFIEPWDVLAPNSLSEAVLFLNDHPDADMIYTDEDEISDRGDRHSPYFKPDWSPDTLLSQMYTGRLAVYRTTLFKSIGGLRKGFEEAAEYDAVLRMSEVTNRIYHIPKVLYHRGKRERKRFQHRLGTNDAVRALEDALQRRRIDGWVEKIDDNYGIYRVHYRPSANPLVSIIILTRDKSDLLDQCLASIFEKTTYKNFEVLIIDNGSTNQETYDIFRKWRTEQCGKLDVLRIDIPFNYSRLNNLAVKEVHGDLVLFLNNDVKVISPEWLEEMAGQASRTSVGAVGAKLLYANDTIQHGGVVLVGGVAGHSHPYFPADSPGYFGRLWSVCNYSAVTGACLMTRKSLFERVGGFDETLSVAFNDVDLCLKLKQAGFHNVWLPQVQLYHYESKTRGLDDTPEKVTRLQREIQIMQQRWGELLRRDPCYNPNLNSNQGDFALGDPRHVVRHNP